MTYTSNEKSTVVLPQRPSHGFLRTLINQIYREKRDKIAKKVFNKKAVKPFMKYREIQIIEEILTNFKPKVCLEWGSGYSTCYFSKYLTQDARWISVEHNGDWARRVAALNPDKRVEICHVAPESVSWAERDSEGLYADFEGYVSFPSRIKEIDFILIDGRARKYALIKAQELIGEKGVVILHDANRTIYHQPFSLYKHQELFTDGRIDGGGIWVGSNGIDLNAVFDVALHKRLWRVYNIF